MRAVVHPDDVEPRRVGNADLRVVFDKRNGCERLEQRVISVHHGRTEPRRLDGEQEILYVVSGRGMLELDGNRYELEPDVGAFVAAGETSFIDVAEPLELVSVVTPATSAAPVTRKVTVHFCDQPEFEASPERTFRYLVDADAGCVDVTQFLGIVQPSKAPFHSHPYDEVGYVVEGEGIAHVDGEQMPLKTGSCFHLAPGQVHCIENTAATPMRIMGVFHPAGSPAARGEA